MGYRMRIIGVRIANDILPLLYTTSRAYYVVDLNYDVVLRLNLVGTNSLCSDPVPRWRFVYDS